MGEVSRILYIYQYTATWRKQSSLTHPCLAHRWWTNKLNVLAHSMSHSTQTSERKPIQLNTNPVRTNSYDFMLEKKQKPKTLIFSIKCSFTLARKKKKEKLVCVTTKVLSLMFYMQKHLWKKLQVNTLKVQEFKVVLLFFFKKVYDVLPSVSYNWL